MLKRMNPTTSELPNFGTNEHQVEQSPLHYFIIVDTIIHEQYKISIGVAQLVNKTQGEE